jgi:hypothetical protein
MATTWLPLSTKPAYDRIANPKNMFDTNHNDYISALSSGAQQQKADVIERQYRMAAHAENSETARQLRILNSVVPNREPTADDFSGRRPGWLAQVEAPRTSRPGDKDEPTKFPLPDDVGGRAEQSKLRRMAEAAVTGRPAGTSRSNNGDLADGVGVWASGRKPGELYPVLSRPTFQFVQDDNLETPVTGPNKSTNNGASWRTSQQVRTQRSNDMPMDFTGAPTHAAMHSTSGNLVVQPSMTLLPDDTGAFGEQSMTGGVSQTTQRGYERGTVRMTAETALPMQQKPSFLLVAKPTAARDGSTRFRQDDENFAADLGNRNKLTDRNAGPRARTDEYKFVDDGRYAVPVPANTTDVQKGPAQTGDMRVKAYDLPTTQENYGRGRHNGIQVLQDTKPREINYRTSMATEDLDEKMYLKALGAGHVVEPTTDRLDMPEQIRYRREALNVEQQQMTAAQRGDDRQCGREILEARDSHLQRQNVRMPEGAKLLGARDQTLSGAAPMTGDFIFNRNQPSAERELIRMMPDGGVANRRSTDIGFEMPQSKDKLSVDMMQHSSSQLQPQHVVVDRNQFVPFGDNNNQIIDVDLTSRMIGVNARPPRDLLLQSANPGALLFR